MGRIEKNETMKAEVQQMKGEVVKEIRNIENGRGKLTCSLIFLLFVFVGFGWIAWMFAATGLMRVPVLSRFAFEEPIPVRIVTPGVPLETVVQEQLQTTLTQRLQQGGGVLQDTRVALRMEESSFTSTLQSTLQSGGFDVFDIERVQMLIQEDGTLELFLPLADRIPQTAFVAVIRLDLTDGAVGVKTESVRLGQFVFPSLFTEFFAQTFIQPQLPALNASLGQYARIRSVTYTSGSMLVEGDFDVEVIPSV